MTDGSGPLWVFGYGSLLWNPGFEVAEERPARLQGYARSFCMLSVHHRGTPERPGLVLALDAQKGAWCDGMALRVAPTREAATLAYLRERELISSAYLEHRLPVDLREGRQISAVAFVVDPAHAQYAGHLSREEQARIIAGAVGGRGPNPDYLHATVARLDALDLHDADLDWLDRRVRAITGMAPTT